MRKTLCSILAALSITFAGTLPYTYHTLSNDKDNQFSANAITKSYAIVDGVFTREGVKKVGTEMMIYFKNASVIPMMNSGFAGIDENGDGKLDYRIKNANIIDFLRGNYTSKKLNPGLFEEMNSKYSKFHSY